MGKCQPPHKIAVSPPRPSTLFASFQNRSFRPRADSVSWKFSSHRLSFSNLPSPYRSTHSQLECVEFSSTISAVTCSVGKLRWTRLSCFKTPGAQVEFSEYPGGSQHGSPAKECETSTNKNWHGISSSLKWQVTVIVRCKKSCCFSISGTGFHVLEFLLPNCSPS